MIEVPMYVPAVSGTGTEARMGGAFARTVKQGSAIVGTAKPDDEERMLVVYYEGNLYGASNMVTFADRAMFAYWRMRDHYPTVAQMAVPVSQLQLAGSLYPEHGRVEVSNAEQLVACAHWLGLEVTGPDLDRLHAELRVSGVRVASDLHWGQAS